MSATKTAKTAKGAKGAASDAVARPAATAADDGRRSIQSVEVGFPLLAALVDAGRPLSLRDLAAAAGMTSAKAHPYLVSYTRVGLVQQDAVTSHYELGPFALQMGLVSLQRLDPVRVALPEVAQLQTQIGHTLGIAVLGSHGPTMIHITEASYPVHVNMRKGTVMSMLHTATGLVFAAWLPPKVAEHYIAREEGDTAVIASHSPRTAASPTTLQAMLADIRVHGMARAVGNPLPGVDALSVPVFDNTGNIVLALTSIGPSGLFDVAWNGAIARPLMACAQEISHKLGYRP
ncbi:MAG: IclR family transcriptional regulator [Bordetella sp.]|nr:IclR family transcriptional regulator [Bordetella sp.]